MKSNTCITDYCILFKDSCICEKYRSTGHAYHRLWAKYGRENPFQKVWLINEA